MDEGSGYCGSSGGIESVSDAAKIANMVMTGAGETKSVWRKTIESNMKPRFLVDSLDIMGMVVGRKREGLTIYRFAEGDR